MCIHYSNNEGICIFHLLNYPSASSRWVLYVFISRLMLDKIKMYLPISLVAIANVVAFQWFQICASNSDSHEIVCHSDENEIDSNINDLVLVVYFHILMAYRVRKSVRVKCHPKFIFKKCTHTHTRTHIEIQRCNVKQQQHIRRCVCACWRCYVVWIKYGQREFMHAKNTHTHHPFQGENIRSRIDRTMSIVPFIVDCTQFRIFVSIVFSLAPSYGAPCLSCIIRMPFSFRMRNSNANIIYFIFHLVIHSLALTTQHNSTQHLLHTWKNWTIYHLIFIKIIIYFLLTDSFYLFQIIFNEQFLVRPNGRVGGRENNNKKDKSTTSETVSPTASLTDIPIVPEFTFTEAVLKSVGIPLNEVIKKVCIQNGSACTTHARRMSNT